MEWIALVVDGNTIDTDSQFLCSQIAPNVTLTDEEKEMRDKSEYQAFQEEERNFLSKLGILKDDDEIILES